MENLSRHIEKLLVRHDYVVVPGLGGFVVQYQSAELIADTIYPPCAVLSFNSLMQHNDGLLAIEVSRTEQISYRSAVDSIARQTEEIKALLLSGQTVQIADLGSFRKDESSNLVFVPNKTPGFLPQNLGLKPLSIHSNTKKSNSKKEIRISVSTTRFYKYAAAVLLLIGLFISSPRLSDTRKSDYASLMPSLVEKPVIQSQEKVSGTMIQDEETVIEDANVSDQQEDKCFHVIVASLPTKESAENFCKELIDSKFTTAHILDPKRTYRIAIQSFDDKDEAVRFMENLRKTDQRFETAWVLCNN